MMFGFWNHLRCSAAIIGSVSSAAGADDLHANLPCYSAGSSDVYKLYAAALGVTADVAVALHAATARFSNQQHVVIL